MPTPDTGGARVPAGRTVLAAGFDVPFRITALADRDLGVSSYSERRVSVGVVDGAAEITILSVVGGALEPCERHGAQTALGPGIEGVLSFLARREEDGVVATPAEDVSIDGLTGPSVTVDLAGATDCAGFIHLFHDGRSSTGVPAGSRITLIEPVPDRVVAIVIPPETLADPASFEPVLDSIDFLEAGS
jgi:hypothetical protein